MREAFIERTGRPDEVVQLRECARRDPGPDEVVLRMQYAPINPADLNFVEGTYGRKPSLPSVPGMEGVGIVEEVGSAVRGLAVGSAALPLRGPGYWSSRVTLPASWVVAVPDGIDLPQAAMLRVNPATAWGMLHLDGEPLPAGSWIAQNAASSAVAACVVQLAAGLGIRTLNFVRRPESAAACSAAGGTVVLTDSADSLDDARAALGDSAPLRAFNAVGGDSALRLMGLLAQGGTLITYGAMGRQPVKVPASLSIFRDVRVRGFWVTKWVESMAHADASALYARLGGLVRDGSLRQPVAAVYPLDRIGDALAHAAQSARDGKILLDLR